MFSGNRLLYSNVSGWNVANAEVHGLNREFVTGWLYEVNDQSGETGKTSIGLD
jgi:hypothetical protein